MGLARCVGVAALLATVGACGASSKEVKAAKQAVYKCDYPVLWKEVRAEFVEHYAKVAEEVSEAGVIISQWEWYNQAGGRKRGLVVAVEPNDSLFRIAVQIVKEEELGGWRVIVDGGAQGRMADSGRTVPYKRGSADEPTWVQTKIDGLAIAIHERLANYEIAATPKE
jgi:hypothetical protein